MATNKLSLIQYGGTNGMRGCCGLECSKVTNIFYNIGDIYINKFQTCTSANTLLYVRYPLKIYYRAYYECKSIYLKTYYDMLSSLRPLPKLILDLCQKVSEDFTVLFNRQMNPFLSCVCRIHDGNP